MKANKSTVLYILSLVSALLIMFLPLFALNTEDLGREIFKVTDSHRTVFFNIGLGLLILAAALVYKRRSWRIGLGLFAVAATVILFGNVVYEVQDHYGFPLADDFRFVPHIGIFLFPVLIVLLILAMKASANEIMPLGSRDQIHDFGNVIKH